MADVSVVSTKLEQIDQYHSELQSMRDLSRSEFLEDVTKRRAVERMFENAIQACADLAKHLATEDFGYDGDASREAVLLLTENDVIDEATASTLADAVGFRNLLAHEYGEIRSEQVYVYLQEGLDVYDEFGQQVAAWVEAHVDD